MSPENRVNNQNPNPISVYGGGGRVHDLSPSQSAIVNKHVENVIQDPTNLSYSPILSTEIAKQNTRANQVQLAGQITPYTREFNRNLELNVAQTRQHEAASGMSDRYSVLRDTFNTQHAAQVDYSNAIDKFNSTYNAQQSQIAGYNLSEMKLLQHDLTKDLFKDVMDHHEQNFGTQTSNTWEWGSAADGAAKGALYGGLSGLGAAGATAALSAFTDVPSLWPVMGSTIGIGAGIGALTGFFTGGIHSKTKHIIKNEDEIKKVLKEDYGRMFGEQTDEQIDERYNNFLKYFHNFYGNEGG